MANHLAATLKGLFGSALGRHVEQRARAASGAANQTPRRPIRWLRWLAYALGAWVLLLIAAWLAVPPIVRGQAESRLTRLLDRRVTVESVSFDPFDLRLALHHVAIADRAGDVPLLTLDALTTDVSAASIWHRAPVFDAVKLTRPSIFIARDRDGRYSIQDLIDKALAPSDAPPARFSLNNVEIEHGSITFDDRVTQRKHVVADLDLGVPFLSSLPYETTINVTPRVAGTLNGSHFALGGSTTPFTQRHEATLDVDIDAIPLSTYIAYLPAVPRFVLASGDLTTRLQIAFVGGQPPERRLELRGTAALDRLAINRGDGSALAAARHIAVAIDRIDLIGSDARIATVSVDTPSVDIKRLASGALEWTQPLFETPPRAVAQPSSNAAARSWQFRIGRFALNDGTVALADESSGFKSTLVDLAVDASNLTLQAGEKAHVKVGFVTSDRIATFTGEADVEPAVPAATGRFALTRFSLGLLFPYYKSALAVDVQKGSLDLASAFALDASGDLRLSEGEATISDLMLALPGNRNPLWRMPQLTAHGIDADVKAHKVGIAELQGQGASLRLIREHDGSLEMARFLRPGSRDTTSSESAPWIVLARKLALGRVAIDFEDRVPEPAVKLPLRELALGASDVGNAPGMKSNVTLRTQVGRRGRVWFAGAVATHPLRINGQVDGSELALAPLQPYVEPYVNVVVTDGTVAAKGRAAVEVPEEGALRATWTGEVAVTDFAALDKPTSSDLARWKTFTVEGMEIGTAPFHASIGRIALADFYARAIVYSDGTLNLVRLVTPGATAAPEPSAEPQVTREAPLEVRHDALPISIGSIDFERGNVNLSDYFVKPNYSVNLTGVTGKVSTMSAEQAGNVAVAASVDDSAPVEIQGRIDPFARELSLDIAAKARDVDLPPLTPYALKYAGYGIEKGKLTFDVHYQLENRKLSAENHLVLDQLTFGQHVDSPTATKLPVLLAVSLLKDANGVIDIHLPIAGSIDDPKFSVGGLIVQVIVNLLTKAATAPFALLSSMFGGGEELSTLEFANGSAAIGPDMQRRVATLAKALVARPALKLTIGGHADPVADREALRRAAVDDAMKRAKMKSLAKEGAAPASLDQVSIGAEERDRWLREAYREAPLPDRPRNVFGILKDVPPAEMEAMLLAHASVDDEALRLLATARAQAVKNAIATSGVPADRLFLVAPRVGTDAAGKAGAGALARVDLSLG